MRIKKLIYPILMIGFIFIGLSWKASSVLEEKPENNFENNTNTFIKESIPSSSQLVDEQIQTAFQNTGLDESKLSYEVFRKAYVGFLNLKTTGKIPSSSTVMSIADFNMSSKLKRLWIVDIANEELLLNTWVSHGRGSGGEMATQFSNTHSSYQSSLGFYVTGEVYYGKHGRSLRLDGMDVGHNNKARERAIVIHGAEYVSANTIKSLNRLGLSHGCPAVPLPLSNHIIDLIKDKTVLFIHSSTSAYSSKYLDEELAGKTLLAEFLDDTINSNYGSL
jgi:hypothetical protein